MSGILVDIVIGRFSSLCAIEVGIVCGMLSGIPPALRRKIGDRPIAVIDIVNRARILGGGYEGNMKRDQKTQS
jgi:hypothetical protein